MKDVPAKTEKQRRFMMADLSRALRGQKTKTGMGAEQLKHYGNKSKRT